MLANRLADHDDASDQDHIVRLRDATWADYQRVLEVRGERPVPRLAYVEGILELMTPSRHHENLKSVIGHLVEAFCLERGIEFSTYGSWTLESKQDERGVEPDECYVFGRVPDPVRPDLVIEVIWTSGGLDKREIYRKLGVREVWFWRRGAITAYGLRGDVYEELTASDVLPGIDLRELVQFVDRPTASQAIREYRALLQTRPVE